MGTIEEFLKHKDELKRNTIADAVISLDGSYSSELRETSSLLSRLREEITEDNPTVERDILSEEEIEACRLCKEIREIVTAEGVELQYRDGTDKGVEIELITRISGSKEGALSYITRNLSRIQPYCIIGSEKLRGNNKIVIIENLHNMPPLYLKARLTRLHENNGEKLVVSFHIVKEFRDEYNDVINRVENREYPYYIVIDYYTEKSVLDTYDVGKIYDVKLPPLCNVRSDKEPRTVQGIYIKDNIFKVGQELIDISESDEIKAILIESLEEYLEEKNELEVLRITSNMSYTYKSISGISGFDSGLGATLMAIGILLENNKAELHITLLSLIRKICDSYRVKDPQAFKLFLKEVAMEGHARSKNNNLSDIDRSKYGAIYSAIGVEVPEINDIVVSDSARTRLIDVFNGRSSMSKEESKGFSEETNMSDGETNLFGR